VGCSVGGGGVGGVGDGGVGGGGWAIGGGGWAVVVDRRKRNLGTVSLRPHPTFQCARGCALTILGMLGISLKDQVCSLRKLTKRLFFSSLWLSHFVRERICRRQVYCWVAAQTAIMRFCS
jgi:hypothetical protein